MAAQRAGGAGDEAAAAPGGPCRLEPVNYVGVMATTRHDSKASPDPGPTVFVLFGATGDLAKRMVIPAFYQLAQEGLLPKEWRLVGNGRGDVAHEDFRKHVHSVLTEFGPKPEEPAWDAFAQRVFFAGGGFSTDDPGSLLDVISKECKALGPDPQLVHYLAVPPSAFGGLTKALGKHGLAKGARVVYEKPFGTSPEGFRELDKAVHSVLDEQQVYRIDHFLGKEATQDVHVLRFANGLFAGMWNRENVESVQIDVPEKLGVTDRSVFYDATGAVLDMMVTHLFQLAAEVAMEPPQSVTATDLQAAREKVINCFRRIDPEEVVLGQFAGYRDVPGVDPKSEQNTFVAARLWIDNERWRGVPFYLRTGKRLAATRQRVSLILRKPGDPLADQLPDDGNVLSFSLAGDGEIDLSLIAKRPGPGLVLDSARAAVPLSTLADGDPLPAYVRLIHDVLIGDRALFTRPDGLAAAWNVVDPLLTNPPEIASYAPGSWGPPRARDLVQPGRWLLGQ
jgi:glucose-6-phosphate 1-dehydrogenase